MPSFSSIFLFASALPALLSATPIKARQDASCPVVTSGDYVWKIDNVYIRKLNGVDVSTMGFDVLATNGGTLNFTCSPFDKASGAAVTTDFKQGTLYSCGENTFIDFTYKDASNGLLLRQNVSDTELLVGSTALPTYCRAGGSSTNDLVCDGVSPAYVTLVDLVQ